MLELILLVNLAFSVVGFFFILRMWKEVKSRRDFYGENFGIPRGKESSGAQQRVQPVPVQPQQPLSLSNEQIAALVAAANTGQTVPPEPKPQEGDYQKLLAALAQNGGA